MEWKSTVPEGTRGPWRVERFTVTQKDVAIYNLRLAFSPGMGGRQVPPGTYTRLMRGTTLVMSDTPAERRDHSYAIRMAKGDVLVNGLGLGLVATAMLAKPEVTSVTVVEKSADVIALVAPHLDPRLAIIEADALAWTPPKKANYGAAWHDIWDDICGMVYETPQDFR